MAPFAHERGGPLRGEGAEFAPVTVLHGDPGHARRGGGAAVDQPVRQRAEHLLGLAGHVEPALTEHERVVGANLRDPDEPDTGDRDQRPGFLWQVCFDWQVKLPDSKAFNSADLGRDLSESLTRVESSRGESDLGR